MHVAISELRRSTSGVTLMLSRSGSWQVMFAGVPCTTSFEVCQVASQAASIIQEGCVVHHAAEERTGCWVGTVSKATLGSSACKLQSTQSSRCVPGPWMMRRRGPDDLRNRLLVYRCCQLCKCPGPQSTESIPAACELVRVSHIFLFCF